MPEMPYNSSLVLTHEPSGVELAFAAEPALKAWARQQRRHPAGAAAADEPGPGEAAMLMKVAPAKAWSTGAEPPVTVSAADDEGLDWTFFTDWAGELRPFVPPPAGAEAAASAQPDVPEWSPVDESGIDLSLLTDTRVPILFFDEVRFCCRALEWE